MIPLAEACKDYEAQPLLFNNLMPGTVRMRWAMDPEPPEERGRPENTCPPPPPGVGGPSCGYPLLFKVLQFDTPVKLS